MERRKGAIDLGAREPIMEDSDGEEPFTFGSFTLEDTREFKKSYSNSLDRKVRESSSNQPKTILV